MSASKEKSQTTGQRGENIAQAWLRQKGYRILARNFRVRGGEIDIIAQKNDSIHFVEVKTRTSRRYGFPEELVTEQKQAKIIQTAEAWLGTNPEIKRQELIFSVIAIRILEENQAEIRFIENAFGE